MQKNQLEVVNIRLIEAPSLYSDKPINTDEDAIELMKNELKQYDREVLCVLNLAVNGAVINMNIASMGTLRESIVGPREVFKSSILSNASHIILLHNHPSGNIEPSKSDFLVTRRLMEAGEILGIPVRDHIIIGGVTGKVYSMAKEDVLSKLIVTEPVSRYGMSSKQVRKI